MLLSHTGNDQASRRESRLREVFVPGSPTILKRLNRALICLLLPAWLALAPAPAIAGTPGTVCILYGDANQDGQVNRDDVALSIAWLEGPPTPDPADFCYFQYIDSEMKRAQNDRRTCLPAVTARAGVARS